MAGLIAGFDIGGTKTSLVLADKHDVTVHRVVEATDTLSGKLSYMTDYSLYDGVAKQLIRMLESALRDLGGATVDAIGIVSAGPIAGDGLNSPPNIIPAKIAALYRTLPRHIPLISPLENAFSCPVALRNDCNGAVIGEVYYGMGKDVADKSTLHLAYATISTGFGVGVWDAGHLVLGKDGNAGELGHIVAKQDGLPCGCGNRGCVEAYCSGSGIVRNARQRLMTLDPGEPGASSLLRRAGKTHPQALPQPTAPVGDPVASSRISPQDVFAAAAAGDPLAEKVVDDAVYAGGIGFAALANAYDPATITVGGSIALAHPEWVEQIEREMRRHLNVRPPEVRLTPLGAGVTERGALALARLACLSDADSCPIKGC